MNAQADLVRPTPDPADAEADRLALLLSELGEATGDELELRVYHVLDGKRGFLFTVDAADAGDSVRVLELLAERAGDGDYELWLKNRKSRSIVQKVLVTIGRLQAKGRPGLQVTPPPAAVSRDTSPIGDPVLRAILEAQTRLLERLVAAPPAPAEKPKTTLEVARELAAIKELFAPPAQSENMLGVIRDVLNIRKELRDADPDADPPDALTAAIQTLGPSIVEGVRALQARGNQTAKPSRLARAIERRAPAAPAQPEAGAMNPETILRSYLPAVLELARAGVKPAEAAQRIVAQLRGVPAPIAEGVLAYLDDVEGSDLVKLEAGIAPFEQWFNDTLDAVFDIVAPEDDAGAAAGADDTAGADGVGSAPTDTRRSNSEPTPGA